MTAQRLTGWHDGGPVRGVDYDVCTAGRSGGWASGRGTTPCGFGARATIVDGPTRYRVCGTHRNAALRDGATVVVEDRVPA